MAQKKLGNTKLTKRHFFIPLKTNTQKENDCKKEQEQKIE